jgi:hypothetical protein
MGAALMAAASPIPLYRSSDDLRERLTQMRDDLVDRMVRRGNPAPAHLPMLAGIEATLRVLDGEEIAAPIIGRPSRLRAAR